MIIWRRKNKLNKISCFFIFLLGNYSLFVLTACAVLEKKPKQVEAMLQTVATNQLLGKILFRENAHGIQMSYNLNTLKPNTRYKLIISTGSKCPHSPSTNLIPTDQINDSASIVSASTGSASVINAAKLVSIVDKSSLPIVRTDAKGVASGVVISQLFPTPKINWVSGNLVTLHADDDFNMSSESEETLDLNKALACGTIQTK